MRPTHLTGDLVEFDSGQWRRTGIVVSVQQSNQVPDAKARGIENVFPWMYWVFDGREIVGPMTGGWLKNVN
jgi:hypothetical protein